MNRESRFEIHLHAGRHKEASDADKKAMPSLLKSAILRMAFCVTSAAKALPAQENNVSTDH